MWAMENTPKAKRRRCWNTYKRTLYANIKALPPEERWERDQRLLWWKLRRTFDKREYIEYESLPEALQKQIEPFEEFLYEG